MKLAKSLDEKYALVYKQPSKSFLERRKSYLHHTRSIFRLVTMAVARQWRNLRLFPLNEEMRIPGQDPALIIRHLTTAWVTGSKELYAVILRQD